MSDTMNDTMTSEGLQRALETARDSISVRRVFGDPITANGLTMIPAGRVAGGAGGGSGGSDDPHAGRGMGAGFGSASRPLGMYVVNGSSVEWKPASDGNLIAILVACVAALALFTLRAVINNKH